MTKPKATSPSLAEDVNTVICLCEAELETQRDIAQAGRDPVEVKEVEQCFKTLTRIRPLLEAAPEMVEFVEAFLRSEDEVNMLDRRPILAALARDIVAKAQPRAGGRA